MSTATPTLSAIARAHHVGLADGRKGILRTIEDVADDIGYRTDGHYPFTVARSYLDGFHKGRDAARGRRTGRKAGAK